MDQEADFATLIPIKPEPITDSQEQFGPPPTQTLPSPQRRRNRAKNATFAAPAPVNNENTVNGVPLSQTPTPKKNVKKRKRASPRDGADQSDKPSKRRALGPLTETNNSIKIEPVIKNDPYIDLRGIQLIPEKKLAPVPVVEGANFLEIQPGSFSVDMETQEGGLYLGNVEVATNDEWQRSVPIHVVVNAAKELHIAYQVPEVQFRANLVDVADERLDSVAVQQVLESMHALRTEGKSVLVHCKLGRSRSVALIICYFMIKCNKTLLEAVEILKGKDIDFHLLNDGFKEQLMEIDRNHNGGYTYVFYDKATRRQRAARQWQSFTEVSRQNQAKLAGVKRTPAKKAAAKKTTPRKPRKTTTPRKPRAKKNAAAATQPQPTQAPASPLNTATAAVEAPRSPSKRQATIEETYQLFEEKHQATQKQTTAAEASADTYSNQVSL